MVALNKTMTNTIVNTANGINYTEGAFALIENVISRTHITNPDKLLPAVCEELGRRFDTNNEQDEGKVLDYHLKQMKLSTTSDVARTIRCFFISRKLYPNTKYASAK